jgi:hypothetical protein
MTLPTQDTVNWGDPTEHVAWALRNLPVVAGVGAVTNPGIIKGWSKHLFDAGFRHVDYLKTLADENGNIHVSKLPAQKIKWFPAFRGPHSGFNNAARWADMDAPPPPVYRIPNIRELTQQENEAMLEQYREAGMLRPYEPAHSVAQVE